jgi:cytochrome P450
VLIPSREHAIPGPRTPRPLQGALFLADEYRYLARCRRRYGDVFALEVWPFHPLVVVGDPAGVKQIFTGDPAQLHAGEGNQVLEPMVGSHSVLVLDEQEHLRTRKMQLPPFHGARMRVYGDVMRELTEQAVATWPVGEAFPLLPEMQRLTLRIILRTVFGLEEGARMAELEDALVRSLPLATRIMLVPPLQRELGPWSPAGRFAAARAEVDRLLLAEIARRRESGVRGDDVMSMLMEADEDASDETLRDHLVTLLVAGHETTATQLSWTFERLVRHPEAMARARDDEAFLDAAVQESQRTRPVLTFAMRTLKLPLDVAGHRVPQGATVGTSVVLMHSREDLYPEPYAFRPERFIGAKPETYGWIPFGGGVRRCLGAAFAQFEMRQVLSVVLARRTLRPADPAPERRRRRGITQVPARGARVIAQPL